MKYTTFILALAGALAWLPTIFKLFTKQKLFGKIISRYNNCNDTQTLFLYKLSLLSKYKPLSLKSVQCELEYVDGTKYSDKARNNRMIVFMNHTVKIEGMNQIFCDKPQVLIAQEKEFLNNFAILKEDTNIEGYLFFTYEHIKKETRIKKTTFIFTSFDGKNQKLEFDEKDIESEQLFYDDTIWKDNG